MSPASESRLEATPPFQGLGATDIFAKMPRHGYTPSPQISMDGLTEATRDYSQGMLSNICYQHHNEVRYGFQDHGIISDYLCSQQQQSLDDSHVDEYSMQESNYSDLPFGGRCLRERNNLISFSAIHAEANYPGDIYNSSYLDESQQGHIFDTESYRTMSTQGHSDQSLKISLMHTADFHPNQHPDTDNEIIHSFSMSAASMPTDICDPQKEEENAVLSRKSGSVARRNARERKRIKNVNVAFDSLRKRVPQGSKGNKISKVNVDLWLLQQRFYTM